MKYPDSNFLNEFYESETGEQIGTKISEYLRKKSDNGRVLILGYGKPFLDKLTNGNLIYAIPDGYEINRWPEIRPFRTVVVDETKMPFASESFNTVIALPFLEYCRNLRDFADEIFRILGRDGSLVTVSFNKSSVLYGKTRHSVRELSFLMSDRNFSLQQAFFINKNLQLFHDIGLFRSLFIHTTPIFYDIIVLDMVKNTAAPKVAVNFQEKYGIS